MSNLKDKLIKLGSENPELQDNLRPILDHLPSRFVTAGIRSEIMELFQVNERASDTLGEFEKDGIFYDSLMDAVMSYFEDRYKEKNLSRDQPLSPEKEVERVAREREMDLSPQSVRHLSDLVEQVRDEFYENKESS